VGIANKRRTEPGETLVTLSGLVSTHKLERKSRLVDKEILHTILHNKVAYLKKYTCEFDFVKS